MFTEGWEEEDADWLDPWGDEDFGFDLGFEDEEEGMPNFEVCCSPHTHRTQH